MIKSKQLDYLKPRLDGRQANIKIYFGDLNGDKINDAFIDWCIEAVDKDRDAGGGNAMMFLECIEAGFSFYINKNNSYELVADKNKNNFTDEGFSYQVEKIENGKIICSCSAYSDDDPRCCPSIKRTIYLKITGNKIEMPDQKVKISKSNKEFE